MYSAFRVSVQDAEEALEHRKKELLDLFRQTEALIEKAGLAGNAAFAGLVDEKIGIETESGQSGAVSDSSAKSTPDLDKREAIEEMLDKGRSMEQIAQEMDIGLGEAQLIANLKKRTRKS